MDVYLFQVSPGRREGEFDYTAHPPLNLADGERYRPGRQPDGAELINIAGIVAGDPAWDEASLKEKWTKSLQPFVPAGDTPEIYYARLIDLFERRAAKRAASQNDVIPPPSPLPADAGDADFEWWTIRNRICPHLEEHEAREFHRLCKLYKVSAIKGEVFPAFCSDEDTGGEKIVLGATIQFMRKRVLQSGTLDGIGPIEWCGRDAVWSDVWLSDSPPHAARVQLTRKGITQPFTGIAYFKGAARMVNYGNTRQPSMGKFWMLNPAAQLGKCALADGFRKGWQDVLDGLVSQEELDNGPPPGEQADTDADELARVGEDANEVAPFDTSEPPVTRQSFELKLINFGIRQSSERTRIIARLRLKFPSLYAQHEDAFWQKAWSEFVREAGMAAVTGVGKIR